MSQVSAQLSLAAFLPLLGLSKLGKIPSESEQGNIMLSLVKTLQEPLSGSWSSEFILSLVSFLHCPKLGMFVVYSFSCVCPLAAAM